MNPIRFTEEVDANGLSLVVVNRAFILWTYELQQEIVRLRKLVK